MAFKLNWSDRAAEVFNRSQSEAAASLKNRAQTRRRKPSRQEGLFKQLEKCVRLLADNPRHPGLQTHAYSIPNPLDPSQRVFEAYVQNQTPAAYRVLWFYGPDRGEITILAITPHP